MSVSRFEFRTDEWKKKSEEMLIIASVLLINAVITPYIIECIWRNQMNLLPWIKSNPRIFLNNVLLFFLFTAFIYFLRGRISSAIRYSNTLFISLAIINYYKIDYRDEPFMLSDFMQLKEGTAVLSHYKLHVPLIAFSLAVLGIGVIPLLFRRMRSKMKFLTRIPFAAVTLVLLVLCTTRLLNRSYPLERKTENVYRSVGMVHGLWATRPQPMKEPENYSKEQAETLLKQFTVSESNTDTIKPDIFFIMCESLFDIAGVHEFTLSEDPLEGLKAFCAEQSCGTVLSQSYGGGTFDIEYEVLTGYRRGDISSTIFNNRSVVYPGMDSIPDMLKKIGYHTAAFHSNHGWFYGRNVAYPYMGFDASHFLDNGMDTNPEMIEGWATNRWLFGQVLKDYRQRDKTKPYFGHIVTTQCHGEYSFEWDKKSISAVSSGSFNRISVETYASLLKDAADAITEFLLELEKLENPVAVVLWGDHAPSVSSFGIELPEDDILMAEFYKTPYLIWNNYGENFNLHDEVIPSYRLGAAAVCSMGVGNDAYYWYLAKTQDPDMLKELYLLEKDGHFYYDEEQFDALDQKLKTLHYYRKKNRR